LSQRFGNTVDGIAIHPLKDAAALLDRVDDHRQTGRQKHNGCRRTRRVGCTGHGDATVRFLQRGRVIHTVARHADDVVTLLQDIHDVKLMFGKHLGKTVRFLNGLDHRRRLLFFRVAQRFGIENIRAHP